MRKERYNKCLQRRIFGNDAGMFGVCAVNEIWQRYHLCHSRLQNLSDLRNWSARQIISDVASSTIR